MLTKGSKDETKRINQKTKKLTNKEKEQFYNDLSILLTSGLNLNTSLQLLSEEISKNENIFSSLNELILTGKPLHKAMKQEKCFTKYEYQSIKIGEETGQLSQVVVELKKYFEKKNQLTKQFINLITYPIIVILFSFGVLTFLMNFVVPVFMIFLNQIHAELPAVTKFVLFLSESFSRWYKIVLFFILLIIALLYFQRKARWFLKYSSIFLLKTPVIGKMIKQVYIARFCQSMDLLLNAKVPLLEALQMTKEMISFYPIETSLNHITKDILKGSSLYKSMETEKIFDKRMTSMIRVGEEVNQLGQIFKKLSLQYTDSVENQTKIIKSVIEPVLIIIVGGVVALVAMAMILPVFKMSSSMNF